MMKFVSYCLAVATCLSALSSCTSSGDTGTQGQLVGSKNRMAYTAPAPLGMTWVPSGVLRMGVSDQDLRDANDAKSRNVQIFGFYMDATEVTNSEYRQFTDYVRDSIAHSLLDHFKDLDDGTQIIDFKQKIKWGTEEVNDVMSSYYIPANESITGKQEFDNMGKLIYNYNFIDYDGLAKGKSTASRKDYISKKVIPIYPDTTVWVKMFSNSYNEPIAQQYFWFKAFDEYPVVGVNWNQVQAFNHWRTISWRNYRYTKKKYTESEFRLPTEAEWEWAARGGRQQSPYPWGGPYILNKKGCYLANFKPNRGNYSADGGLYTVKATAYWPNDYGLYNMSGNVSEWTSSLYSTNAYGQISDMSGEINYKVNDNDPQYYKRRVIRGGSWKDVHYYLQVSTRDWEFQDTTKAYIGFRSIIPNIASSLTNKPPKR
jgi:formylglycine-generating enzyme